MSQAVLSGSQLNSGRFWKTLPLAFLICVTFAKPSLADDKDNTIPSLDVTGHGVVKIATTLSQVDLGVEVQGKTAQEVQQEVARRSSSVVSLLRSQNVEQLQTTGINLNPQYSYKDNVQRLIGYIANNSVTFRINTDKAGPLIDRAVQAGATQINGISFVGSDEAIAQARQEALKKATQDAQQQANTVFSTLGLKPKQVISIQLNADNAYPPPVYLEREAAKVGASAPSTPVVGGEQKLEASVTLKISY